MKRLIFFGLILFPFMSIINAQDVMSIHKSDGTILKIELDEIDSILFDKSGGAKVIDTDGNEYSTLVFGSQSWMAENLRTTKFNDNNSIPLQTDDETWGNLLTPAYCWYDNNEASYKNWYGALYNWYAVSTDKLCPIGWHVPSDDDWNTLQDHLIANGYNFDGTTTDNKIAKALASKTEWTSSSNIGAVGNTDYPEKRNATGFTARPAGLRESATFNGHFASLSIYANFWTKTEYDDGHAWYRQLSYSDWKLLRVHTSKSEGFSVRCIKN